MNKYIRNPLISVSLSLFFCVLRSFCYCNNNIKNSASQILLPSLSRSLRGHRPRNQEQRVAWLRTRTPPCFFFRRLPRRLFRPLPPQERIQAYSYTCADINWREGACGALLWLIEAAVPSGDRLLSYEFQRMRGFCGYGRTRVSCVTYVTFT